jgi:peptidoglycan/xylan/chitin deacetylase (PgdA/CDA1 family)
MRFPSLLLVAFGLSVAACGEPASEDVDDESGAAAVTSSAYCTKVGGLARDGKLEQIDCGISRGPKTEKKIALVFTAGYFCEGGPTFLDTLKQHDARASFFLLSAAAKTQDAGSKCNVVVPRLVREGHYVGPHSDTHPDIVDRQGGTTKVTKEKLATEIRRNVEVLRSKGVTGDIRYWMPPSETFNAETAAWSAENGLFTVHLTDCPQTRGDYLPASTRNGFFSKDAIANRVVECAARGPSGLNGAILFFHLGVGTSRPENEKFHLAFPAMMQKLVDQGYSFVRIDELLDPILGH